MSTHAERFPAVQPGNRSSDAGNFTPEFNRLLRHEHRALVGIAPDGQRRYLMGNGVDATFDLDSDVDERVAYAQAEIIGGIVFPPKELPADFVRENWVSLATSNNYSGEKERRARLAILGVYMLVGASKV